jgi:Flp pilus assembly protein TadD/4-amino-4-deoxy-L-arabinose transferase-like glycosyltransferase
MVSLGGEKNSADRRGAESPRLALFSLEATVLLAILIIGLWLRWSYFQEIRFTPEFDHPLVDPLFNDYWARGMVTGDWSSGLVLRAYGVLPDIPNQPYFRAPGYAFFLAAIYRVFGSDYAVARVVQACLGILSTLMSFVLGRAVFGRLAGFIFALFMSTYWGFIYFEGELAEPSVLVFLLLLLAYLFHRCARFAAFPNALLAGLVLGLAALMRGNVLVLTVPAVAWGWHVVRRRRGRRWFRAFSLLLLLGTAATIAPTAVRNYLVSGECVPISSNFGVNLYIGNNESAEGVFVSDSPEISRFGSCFDYPRMVAGLRRELGAHLTHTDVSLYYASRAVEFAKQNPGRFLRLTLKKAYLLLSPHEITLNKVVHYERMNSRTLSSMPLSFPLVLALGIVGTVLLRGSRLERDAMPCQLNAAPGAREAAILFPLLAGTYLASLLPFFVTSAYRMPVVPLLLLMGAHALSRIVRWLVTRDFRAASLSLAMLLGIFALARIPFVPYEPGLAKWHLDRGIVRALSGNDLEAAREYRNALSVMPESAVAHHNLGIVLARGGQLDEAYLHFASAARLDPQLASAHIGLADVRLAQGRRDDAAESYRRAIEVDPRSVGARRNLSAILIEDGEFAEAIRLLEEALAIDCEDVTSMVNLAWVLAVSPLEGLRDGERAVLLAEHAVRLTGSSQPAPLGTLAAAYAEAGNLDAAVAAAEKALKLARETGSPTRSLEDALRLYKMGRPWRAELR